MNRLKAVLQSQGRTQVFLSNQLNKTPNTINLWCRNVVQPSIPDLYKISALLDVTISDLLIETKELKMTQA